jgi:5-methyltetrahydropteroyltriglutamate--homocysteine methyltransferase
MTDRPVKVTLPGPFTLSQQAKDEWYHDPEAVAMDFAAAVNEEARELQAAGADVIQLDEPWLRNDPEAAERYAVGAINRALEGITATTAVHLCFGYAAVVGEKPSGYTFLPQLADCSAGQISIEAAQPKLDLGVLDDLAGKVIVLGVIDLQDPEVEPVEVVEARIRRGLERLDPTHLVAAPDCGMKYLPRATAFNKLRALADAARSIRAELGRE